MTGADLALAGDIRPHTGPALLAVAADLDSASAAVSAGADLIDLGDAPASDVTAFLAMHPGVPFCAQDDRAALSRPMPPAAEVASTATTGAALLCADLATAMRSRLPRDRLVVQTTLPGLLAVTQAGYQALVQLDPDPADEIASVAAAALSCWLGAAMVRTRHTRRVRRALDMTASIQGLRPPSRTVRGLA
jgi:hypothetical protein